ncbi:MAG TPA: histidine kinase dimerization/phosphoacceptor domain -containing protein [Coleofasciculaceae cyanobacterium]
MNNPPSILIVDDELENFDVLETFLLPAGYQLYYAASGANTLTFLQTKQPDLILLDVMMPEMDGVEVCRQIKNEPCWSHIPIIIVTALTAKEDLARCLDAGADDFLSKPVNRIELLARIRSLLRIKQQHEQLQTLLSELEQRVKERTAELQQLNKELHQSKLFVEGIVNTSPQLLYIYDPITKRNLYVNQQIVEITGYTPEEMQQAGSQLFLDIIHPDDLYLMGTLSERFATIADGEVVKTEYRIKHKNGTWCWIRSREVVFNRTPDGTPTEILGTAVDISDRKLAEEQLKASLQEKDVLLNEIHHRVKNNLQIISSLLKMQERRVQDPQLALVLRDSQNRVASIALVHEKLYRSDNLAQINFGQYIFNLTGYLFYTYQVSSNQIDLTIKADNIFLNLDIAIPCGLIVTELVSNALKYAFPDNQKGKIQVEFRTNHDHTLCLVVRDNGIGMPKDFDIETTESLGLTLVQQLVEQIEGKLKLERRRGTEFTIFLPLAVSQR